VLTSAPASRSSFTISGSFLLAADINGGELSPGRVAFHYNSSVGSQQRSCGESNRPSPTAADSRKFDISVAESRVEKNVHLRRARKKEMSVTALPCRRQPLRLQLIPHGHVPCTSGWLALKNEFGLSTRKWRSAP
jgi:hypothetical protein